jgi:vancomycin resistance protein YoaR
MPQKNTLHLNYIDTYINVVQKISHSYSEKHKKLCGQNAAIFNAGTSIGLNMLTTRI